jgi:hypothetical protein
VVDVRLWLGVRPTRRVLEEVQYLLRVAADTGSCDLPDCALERSMEEESSSCWSRSVAGALPLSLPRVFRPRLIGLSAIVAWWSCWMLMFVVVCGWKELKKDVGSDRVW